MLFVAEDGQIRADQHLHILKGPIDRTLEWRRRAVARVGLLRQVVVGVDEIFDLLEKCRSRRRLFGVVAL